MNNGLLICPICESGGTRSILGSVTHNNELVVLRFRSTTTTIKALEYTVFCDCGFGTTINYVANGHALHNHPHSS